MITKLLKLSVVGLIALTLALVGCSDQALTNLSKALADTSHAVATLQQVTIDGNRAGSISDQDAAFILQICGRVNAGGQESSKAIRQLTQLAPADRKNVYMVIKPLADAVNDAVARGLIGIKNPDTQKKVMELLQVIQTGLNAAEAITAATGA